MGKNKKKKESEALLRIAIQAQNGTLPPPRKVTDLSEFFEPQQQAQKQDKIIGDLMYVPVDDDIDIKETHLAQLPPPCGTRSKTTDLDRYFKWQLKEELLQPGARLDKITCGCDSY